MFSEGSKYAGLGYSIIKDLVRLGRREALHVRLDAVCVGSALHLRLTARTGLGAGKVNIKRCFAIRWDPYAGCIPGDQHIFREVRFQPVGPPVVTLEGPVTAEWTATLNRDRVLHLEVAAQRAHDMEVFSDPEASSPEGRSFGPRQMRIAAVVVTGSGKPVQSNEVFIPPAPPIKARIAEWWAARREAQGDDDS